VGPENYFLVYKCPPLLRVLSQMNSLSTLSLRFFSAINAVPFPPERPRRQEISFLQVFLPNCERVRVSIHTCHMYHQFIFLDLTVVVLFGVDRGITVIKVLCYKSEGRWFDPSWCRWIFHWHKILPIALWPWGSNQPLTEMSTGSISWE
jgi:hypothetical protein